jgi:hypothetical protein
MAPAAGLELEPSPLSTAAGVMVGSRYSNLPGDIDGPVDKSCRYAGGVVRSGTSSIDASDALSRGTVKFIIWVAVNDSARSGIGGAGTKMESSKLVTQ